MKQTSIISTSTKEKFSLTTFERAYFVKIFISDTNSKKILIPDALIHSVDRSSMHNLQHKAEVLATAGGQMVNMMI